LIYHPATGLNNADNNHEAWVLIWTIQCPT